MIRLFTTSFPEQDPERRAEYDEALARNIACGAISEICILDENPDEPAPHSKVVRRRLLRRPLYNDYFEWIDEVAADDDISIIANADIGFDDTIRALECGVLEPRTVVALARWDKRGDGVFAPRNRNDSQDSWIFRGKIRGVDGSFLIGVPRCDNRLAKVLETAGYSVINPAFSIRSFHFHSASRDNYPGGKQPGFVDGPYGYIWPHNLLSAYRTLAHNVRHPDMRLAWHFDARLLKSRMRFYSPARIWSALTRSRPASHP